MKSKKKEDTSLTVSQEQLMELMNLTIELHALYRIFDHASCDRASTSEEGRRVYKDIASLLRPICIRLDKLEESIVSH